MGLVYEDLKGTILPYISIDESAPKSGIDKEIIVVGFYAEEEGPANDLNTFIQRGSFDVLDTEVSPNPDEDGRYLIFIEFERNEIFKSTFAKFVVDVENLTGPQEWQVKPYLADEAMELNDPELYSNIVTDPGAYMTKDDQNAESSIKEAFKNSQVSGLTFDDDYVIFTHRNDRVAAKIVEFGNYDAVATKHYLTELAINLSPRTEIHCLDVMLGEQWNVFDLDKFVVLEDEINNEVLLVRDVQFMYGRNL